MDHRLTSFGYKGTLLFEELFPNELEVLEAELLEANLEDLTLNDGETIQLLTIPNIRYRRTAFQFTNQFKTIARRLELIFVYLTDRKNYDEYARDEKSIAQLGDPSTFAMGDVDYVKNAYYAYNRFVYKPQTITMGDFRFLSTLQKHYKSKVYGAIVSETFRSFRLKAFDFDPTLRDNFEFYTDRIVNVLLINPNPGQSVISLSETKIIVFGYHLLLTNFTYHQLIDHKEKFNLNLPKPVLEAIIKREFIHPDYLWKFYNNKTGEPVDFTTKVKQMAIAPSQASNDLMHVLVYYALLNNFMDNKICVDFGSPKFQFVSANWSVERLRLSVFLSTVVSKYLGQKNMITIKIADKGLLLLVEENGREVDLLPDFVRSFNDAVEIMESSMFVD